ncbi:hypothetical protein [Mesorhizobium sp. A556]
MSLSVKNIRNIAAVLASTAVAITTSARADVTARYGELQAVIDAINDPDPLMRLAQLEEILQKGNATEVQLAIRTAFEVDDPNVRSLALRAHFASFRTFIVSAELPGEVKNIVDGNDQKAKDQYYRSHGDYLEFLNRIGYQFSFSSEYPANTDLEFQIESLNNNPKKNNQEIYGGTGSIRGGLINIATDVRPNNNNTAIHCSFEFLDYSAFTLKGFASCDMAGGFQFPVALHLFDQDKPTVAAD